MTQYDNKVKEHKEKLAVEEWGKQVKYLHINNGIIELAFNNGNKHFEETSTGKKWKEKPHFSEQTLLTQFSRWLSDVTIGRDPNGI